MRHFYYANVHYTIRGKKVRALRACCTLNGHPEGKAQAQPSQVTFISWPIQIILQATAFTFCKTFIYLWNPTHRLQNTMATNHTFFEKMESVDSTLMLIRSNHYAIRDSGQYVVGMVLIGALNFNMLAYSLHT